MTAGRPIDTKLEDVAALRERVAELERYVADLEAGLATMQSDGTQNALLDALNKTRDRLERVEHENREFATMYVELAEQNEALTNLYVASQRLHAAFELAEVKQIIAEILVEMVGAEEFGLLVLDRTGKQLHVLAGEGIHERLPKNSLATGEGVIGDVAATGESFFFEPQDGSLDSNLPLATLPMKLNGTTVGVLVIYKLLSHKRALAPIDHQILELVAAHSASALVAAKLHSSLDRKMKTIEGFLQLMKSR